MKVKKTEAINLQNKLRNQEIVKKIVDEIENKKKK